MNNWNRLLNWKGPGTYSQSSKLFKRFLKIVTLVYIYQLAKFGYLMSCGLKDISKNAPCSCTNIHHDVTDLVEQCTVKDIKTSWISWERNIIFLRNKKVLNKWLRWHILRRYRFVAEVTFKQFEQKRTTVMASNIFFI